MPHEIFISYSTQDSKVANELCKLLEARGIDCWIAPRDILVSDDWIKELCHAIETCRIVIFLLSSKSNLSIHVQSELQIARFRCDRKIVPLRIENVEPAIHLDYILSACQRFDVFPPPLPQHLDKLSTDIQQLLGSLDSKPLEPRIVSPGAAEAWNLGEHHEIRWEVPATPEGSVQRLKLSLCQGTREIQILADSTAGFPTAASHCPWSPSPDLPPGEDYQLRLEIVDEQGRVGTSMVDFALQKPAAAVEKSQSSPSTAQASVDNEQTFQATPEKLLLGFPPPGQSGSGDPSQPARDSSAGKLPLPSLPLGYRLVYLCSICFAFTIGIGGALHSGLRDGYALWTEFGPRHLTLEERIEQHSPSFEEYRLEHANDDPPMSEGGLYATWLATSRQPEKADLGASTEKMIDRVSLILGRALYGATTAGLWGLGIGAAIGSLWWIGLRIAAWRLRRPLEIVFDDCGIYFDLSLSLGAIIPAMFVLMGGLNVAMLVCGVGLGILWGGVLAALNVRTNRRRQDIILGNESSG